MIALAQRTRGERYPRRLSVEVPLRRSAITPLRGSETGQNLRYRKCVLYLFLTFSAASDNGCAIQGRLRGVDGGRDAAKAKLSVVPKIIRLRVTSRFCVVDVTSLIINGLSGQTDPN
jgi:hypothetical protein